MEHIGKAEDRGSSVVYLVEHYSGALPEMDLSLRHQGKDQMSSLSGGC